MTTLTTSFFSGVSLKIRYQTFRLQLSVNAAKRKVYYTTLRALEQCSARDLRDLRIASSSIHQIAREAAYGS